MTSRLFFGHRDARNAANTIRAALLAVALLMSIVVLVDALGQGKVPERAEAAPTTTGDPLDLSAMTLQPYDLPDEGYAVQSTHSNWPLSEDNNFYGSTIVLPDPSNVERTSREIVSNVQQWPTVEPAADLVAIDQEGKGYGEPLDGTRSFGDASAITRRAGATEDGSPFRQLRLAFHVDNLLASITITDHAGGEPTVAEIEALAVIMADRIVAVRSAERPALSAKLLIVDPGREWDEELATWTFGLAGHGLSVPLQLDGRAVRFLREDDDRFQHRAEFWAKHGVIDVYQNEVYLTHPYASEDLRGLLSYASRIYRFEDEDEAAAFVEVATEDTVASPGHLSNVEVVDLSGFGGSTSAIAYNAPLGDIVLVVDDSRLLVGGNQGKGVTMSGIRIWTQVDTYVVRVEAASPGGVTLDGVQRLTAAQIACLADKRCPPITVPDGLLNE